ncbi:MAG TPA: OmpA family protein [Cytophagaceae bacterium]
MKNFALLLTLLLISFQISLAQDDKLVKKADKLFEEKNFFGALKIYEQAFEQNKEDPHVNLQIAKCYLITSPKTKALSYAITAVANSPQPTSEMYFTLAQACHYNHKFDQAILNYTKSDPGNRNKKQISKLINECNYGKKYLANPVNVKITNAGPLINTEHQEYLPYITADRSYLFFTSRRPGSTGGKKDVDGLMYEDIYVAKSKGGAWDHPVNIGAPLNSDIHDACIGISENGQTMFVYKGVNGGDIYISELKGNKWQTPKPLPINTQFFETSACLSPDERTLFFVRAADAYSNRDIYYCSRTVGGNWSAPRKVNGINTEYDEDAPFMHPDGKTLYFSSKGHSSMGGYDVFKSVLQKDGSWSTPVNLGYPINTAGDDVYFVLSADGKVGFYSSDKEGGYGKQDIYSIRMPVSEKAPELALLKGKVKNEAGNPVEAEITVTDNETKEIIGKYTSNSATGEYLIALPSGKNYGIAIEQPGHLFYSENVYLKPEEGYKEINEDIKLVPAKSGATVVLKNIFFDSGKSDLRPESTTELDKLVKLLNNNATLRIEISGHTDNIGDPNANQLLSERRAQAVVNYLTSKGISKQRLTAKGYGSNKPIADNGTAEGRQKNRRTEFKIL